MSSLTKNLSNNQQQQQQHALKKRKLRFASNTSKDVMTTRSNSNSSSSKNKSSKKVNFEKTSKEEDIGASTNDKVVSAAASVDSPARITNSFMEAIEEEMKASLEHLSSFSQKERISFMEQEGWLQHMQVYEEFYEKILNSLSSEENKAQLKIRENWIECVQNIFFRKKEKQKTIALLNSEITNKRIALRQFFREKCNEITQLERQMSYHKSDPVLNSGFFQILKQVSDFQEKKNEKMIRSSSLDAQAKISTNNNPSFQITQGLEFQNGNSIEKQFQEKANSNSSVGASFTSLKKN